MIRLASAAAAARRLLHLPAAAARARPSSPPSSLASPSSSTPLLLRPAGSKSSSSSPAAAAAAAVALPNHPLRPLSTRPDYADYETWHRDNYEDAAAAERTAGRGGGRNDRHNRRLAVSGLGGSPEAEGPRTSVLMELSDRVGALHDVLRFL